MLNNSNPNIDYCINYSYGPFSNSKILPLSLEINELFEPFCKYEKDGKHEITGFTFSIASTGRLPERYHHILFRVYIGHKITRNDLKNGPLLKQLDPITKAKLKEEMHQNDTTFCLQTYHNFGEKKDHVCSINKHDRIVCSKEELQEFIIRLKSATKEINAAHQKLYTLK